ncbi:hypothetical protein [Leifsonia aquatica]|uniref:hypothetical protein n=1 Tax=Leifsonia aquatica TaxID=144185 RepID=UPI00046AA731|nr:hypothetical protein [Leifsonia aquatica]
MTTIDQHTFSASVNVTGGTLAPESARITLDEGWSPYIQAEVTCAAPAGAVLERIDPREDVRASLVLRRDFGGSDPASVLSAQFAGKKASAVTTAWAGLHARDVTAAHFYPWNDFGVRLPTTRTMNLSVRSRRRGHRDGTLVLTLASDEALLQDYKLVDTQPYTPTLSSVRAVVQAVLGRIGRALVPGTADGTIDAAASIWKPGVSGWDYLAPLVQQAALRLWCDEFGLFHLDAGAVATATGSLALSYTGTVTAAEDSIDRDTDDWYDAVIITYSWTDALGVQQTAYDAATTPGYSRALALEYDTPYPGPGAAQAVLNRAIGRGRVLSPTAVSDYAATPGQPVTITLDDTPIQTGYVSSVVFEWPADEMTVKTRGLIDTPPTAWAFLPAGERWIDSPAGASWIGESIG